ncbi:MAG: HAD family phosphatase [Clostridia bacterium]|nr:HAD family phosphatase [Clostridia bacterium]
MAIKNIIFDIGNVLVDFRWKQYMIDLGFSDKAVEDLGKGMVLDPLWVELDRGEQEEAQIIDQFRARLPEYTDEIDLYWKEPTDMISMRPGSDEWVKGYKDRGFNIYLLSNYPKGLFACHEKKFLFLPYVDGKVVSYEVKKTKPEREIYEALISKYDLVPQECVFIDDVEKNVNGAKAIGIHGVVYVTREQVIEDVEQIITECK